MGDANMDKKIFDQYRDMQVEIESIRRDVSSTEDSIAKLIEEGTVKDRVYGGEGGIQGFNLEGFPVMEYERRLRILKNKRNKLIEKENDLIELTVKVERMIDDMPSSRERVIFHGVFIDGMTQEAVAKLLHIDRSLVSKIITKNLEVSHNSQKK